MFLVFRTVDLVVTNQPYQQPPLYPMFKLKEIQSNSTVVLGGLGSDAQPAISITEMWQWYVDASEIWQFYQLIGLWRRSTHFFHRSFSYVTGGFLAGISENQQWCIQY